MPSMTITTTTEEAQRLAVAVGSYLDLKDENGDPRSATATEIKNWTISVLRARVRQYERRVAEQALAAPTAFDPT